VFLQRTHATSKEIMRNGARHLALAAAFAAAVSASALAHTGAILDLGGAGMGGTVGTALGTGGSTGSFRPGQRREIRGRRALGPAGGIAGPSLLGATLGSAAGYGGDGGRPGVTWGAMDSAAGQ
jgi:hypothetical protein